MYGQILVLVLGGAFLPVFAAMIGDVAGVVSRKWFDRLIVTGMCGLAMVAIMLLGVLFVSAGNLR